LAHHADDQMETMLMRFIRGTGVSGLRGMDPDREWHGRKLVRPLLSIAKREIEVYCMEHRLQPRMDPSNDELTFTRNRIRHQLIPWLTTLNPRVRTAFLQLADLAREEERMWEEIVRVTLLQAVKEWTSVCIILRVPSLLSCSIALQRRVIQHILSSHHAMKFGNSFSHEERGETTFESIERVRWLLSQPHPSLSIDLRGGLCIKRRYEECIFQNKKSGEEQNKGYSSQICPVFIPGMISILDFQGKIEVIVSPSPNPPVKSCMDWAVFDGDLLCGPVSVRKRQPGDVMTCFGMTGKKKVKNVLIEAKVPKDQRDFYPIVVMKEQILWIPGVRRSNLAIITPSTKRYLYFLWHVDGQ
jgi:tRNA(Ile)-lysidine synthase